MARRLLLVVLVCLVSASSASANFFKQMDIPAVIKQMQTEPACGTPALARICRAMPWPLRTNEGVVGLGAMLLLFVQDPPANFDGPLRKWSARFSEEKREEFTSLFSISNPNFVSAVNSSPFVSIYVIHLENAAGRMSPKSVLLIGKGTLSDDQRVMEEALTELNGGEGEWIPPETFTPRYEFVSLTN